MKQKERLTSENQSFNNEEDNFPDESVDGSTSSNIAIETDRRRQNCICMAIPIILTGILMIAIGITAYTKVKPQEETPLSMAQSQGISLDDQHTVIDMDIDMETVDAKDAISLQDQFCRLNYISTKEGRLMCETVCKEAKCCYTKGKKCKNKDICDKYEPCMILGIATKIDDKIKIQPVGPKDNIKTYEDKVGDACSSLGIVHKRRLCHQLCYPAKCCFDKKRCSRDEGNYCASFNGCQGYYLQVAAEASIASVINDDDDSDDEIDDYLYYNVENYYEEIDNAD